ncbi:MAG: fibronectin type III domain-containing protein [Marinoscillum sp.]
MKQLVLLIVFAITNTTLFAVDSNSDLKNTKPVTRNLGAVGGYLEHLPPGYHNSTKKYPLLVYLHGTGERGNGSSDLYEIAKVGCPSRRAEENGSICFNVGGVEKCFIVISPQLKPGNNWTSANQEKFWKYILDEAGYKIDMNRVYLTGHSLGGNGVWEAAYSDYNSPNRFAAIAPLSYWTNVGKVCRVADREIPVWGFCGEWDGKFINQSRTAISILNSCPNRNSSVEVKLTIVPKSGHSITGPTYRVDHSVYNQNLYEWLLTKTKGSGGSSGPAVPNAPGQVQASTQSSSSIKITWDDHSNVEEGFIIKRSKSSGSGFTTAATVGANSTTFTDKGLNESTKYYYKLQAYNESGNSEYTNQASATTTSTSTGGDSDGYITWTNIHGAVQKGPDLEKTTSYGWGNSGAESRETIGSNQDGWIEMVIKDVSKTDLVFGLSDDNLNDQIGSTDYGFELSRYNRAFWKRENGNRKYLGTYNSGDVLRIQRSGNKILYKKNGSTIASSNISSAPSLVADVCIYSTAATVFDGKIHATSGSSQDPADGYINWVNINGAAKKGNDLEKTASYGWGNSGAESNQTIGSNSDGWIEMAIEDDTKTDLVFGLSKSNINDNIGSTDYGFELSKYNRAFWKRENGDRKYLGNYKEGDILKIERSGNRILYRKNGNTISTTNISSSPSLVADVAFLNTGATVFKGKISSGSSNSNSSFEEGAEYVNWVSINGAVQNGNDLKKTASYGWGNSGAESSQSLASGSDGWVEMTLQETDKANLAFGLSSYNTNDRPESIDYGFEVSRYNNAYWQRESSNRVYLGTYSKDDVLRIERKGNNILYKKNGNTAASTTVSSKPEMVADVSLVNTDATVFQAKIYSASGSSSRSAEESIAESDDLTNEQQIVVFPNPIGTDGRLNVNVEGYDLNESARFLVYDLTGALILDEAITSNTTALVLGNLSQSMYTYKMMLDGQKIKSGLLKR